MISPIEDLLHKLQTIAIRSSFELLLSTLPYLKMTTVQCCVRTQSCYNCCKDKAFPMVSKHNGETTFSCYFETFLSSPWSFYCILQRISTTVSISISVIIRVHYREFCRSIVSSSQVTILWSAAFLLVLTSSSCCNLVDFKPFHKSIDVNLSVLFLPPHWKLLYFPETFLDVDMRDCLSYSIIIVLLLVAMNLWSFPHFQQL